MLRTTNYSSTPLAQIVADENATACKDEGYSSPILGLSVVKPTRLCCPPSPVFSMAQEMNSPSSPKKFQVYKLVLTGGPCGGKTTGQDRLATFFENLGWKVFTVPETATILLNGRVKFAELNQDQAFAFQTDILRTMLQIENTFFNQAHLITDRNVLVICDRGAMDPSAYMPRDEWMETLKMLNMDEFELLNTRYNQVIHLVTAADGAEDYYTLGNNAARSEGLNDARALDEKTRKVWIGHPYVDIVDNSECKKFEDKVLKLIQVVCDRTGIETKDRLCKNSKKRKWLVVGVDEANFEKSNQFIMRHDYLLSDTPDIQVRIRSRSQGGRVSYSLTTREYHAETKECIETRMQISEREYRRYLAMRDNSRDPLYKLRRAFMVGNQYFNLDTYTLLPPGLKKPIANDTKLMFLETYTTRGVGEQFPDMPSFLKIQKEITGDGRYSMYELAKKPGVESDGVPFIGAAEYKDD